MELGAPKVENPKTTNVQYWCTRVGVNDSCVGPQMANVKVVAIKGCMHGLAR